MDHQEINSVLPLFYFASYSVLYYTTTTPNDNNNKHTDILAFLDIHISLQPQPFPFLLQSTEIAYMHVYLRLFAIYLQ